MSGNCSEARTSGSEYIPDSDDNSGSDKDKRNKRNRHDNSGSDKIKRNKRKRHDNSSSYKDNRNKRNRPIGKRSVKKINILQDVTIQIGNAQIPRKDFMDDNKIDESYVMRRYFQTEGDKMPTFQNVEEEMCVPNCLQVNDENKAEKERKLSNETSKTSNDSSDNVFRKSNAINSIKINPASKRNGKRIRNKTHVCYFCEKLIINMARHFEVVHSEETEVSKYLAYPKNSRERRDGFKEIIRVGDFYHNCNVLATKKGELILIRRPTESEINFIATKDYGPCPNCLGFLLKKHIWHHIKFICKEKSISVGSNSKHVIAESNAIMADIYGLGFTKDFTDVIISTFQLDNIGSICQSDILIMKFGAMQFEKYGKTQNELIRQTMRQLARLTIALQEISKNPSQSLRDFLVPENFDLVVQATKSISMSLKSDETCRPQYHTPSLALKLGYALKKCISIERGTALRSGNLKRNRSLLSFLHLMNMEWDIRISSNALSTLYRRKINATELLPITSDLVKLSKYIDDSILTTKLKLENERSNATWTKLAILVLARIILFNKRRSGEAARMKMSDYISRPSWKEQNTEEMKLSLTPVEQKLAENLIIVEIEGKRGRKVPVILSSIIKECIDILIRHRDECKISFHNKYVFARSHDSVSYLRGDLCLKKICDEIDLENPSIITGTKLRKYVATVCQLLNMTENEYDWLARHLGHDIKVHRNFYRMQESAIELTKISRLLLAVDNGEVNKFVGKNIGEIDIKGMQNLYIFILKKYFKMFNKRSKSVSYRAHLHSLQQKMASLKNPILQEIWRHIQRIL